MGRRRGGLAGREDPAGRRQRPIRAWTKVGWEVIGRFEGGNRAAASLDHALDGSI